MTNGPILKRATLNGLTPRTMRDAERSPYDWLDGFTPRESLSVRLSNLALLFIVVAVVIGACFGFFPGAAP
jgi:hypothetical protein